MLTEEERLEKNREYQRKWREANKEKIRGYEEKNREKRRVYLHEYNKTYYQENRNEILADVKKHRVENRDRINKGRKEFRDNNKEHIRAQQKKHYNKHRSKILEEHRNYKKSGIHYGSWYRYKTQYGLEPGDYFKMLESQNGGCAICGSPPKSRKRLSVDHDHKSGKVRGLLCMRCNVSIGAFQDDANLLEKAAQYLKRNVVILSES